MNQLTCPRCGEEIAWHENSTCARYFTCTTCGKTGVESDLVFWCNPASRRRKMLMRANLLAACAGLASHPSTRDERR